VQVLRCKEATVLIADAAVKFVDGNFGIENSEIAREQHTALKLRISEMRTNLSQVLRYLQSGAQVDSKLFPQLSEDTVVKIILHLIKCHPPTENDEQNSNIVNQHGTEHHWSAGSFQNNKFLNSNDTKSLQDDLESAFNERLLTFQV
jgi:hypothetical protein